MAIVGLSIREKRDLLYAMKAKARLKLLPFILYTKPDYKAGWFHHELAGKLDEFLADVVAEKSPRMIIMAPPRHGKSEIVSRRFPAFAFGRFPDLQMIATSYSSDLASAMNRDVQKIIDTDEYAELFPDTKLSGAAVRTVTAKGSYLRNSENFEIVGHKGGYKSAGVCTGITGRGGHVLLIDDPVKDAQEAYSPTTRESVWNWYESTLKTRAEPGGGILLIMCMTGDTPVLMSDGTEKPMLEIRPGDEIATFKDGALSTSTVKHWINQGSDKCFAIKTSSGRIVKANERHPFLVRRNGEVSWVRLRDLRVSDKMICAGAPGRGGSAQSMSAGGMQSAKGSACPTTTNSGGQMVSGRPLSTTSNSVRRICGIAMELKSSITRLFSRNSVEDAQCAASLQQRKMFAKEQDPTSALTTITPVAKSEDCYATNAISLLDTEKHLKTSLPLPNTYEVGEDEIVSIESAGHEDVFDIEVEETANFIANGIVASNTRWHEDDLAGRLIAAMKRGGEQWTIVKYPAIAEEIEPYRNVGDPLHAERYPVEALNRIRYGSGDLNNVGTGSRVWTSLYQQRPAAAEGTIFKREHWKFWEGPPHGLIMEGDDRQRLLTFLGVEQVIQYWDTAIGGKQEDDYTACTTLGICANRYCILDFWMDKIESPQLLRQVRLEYDKWRPSQVGMEGGGSASGKMTIQILSEKTLIPFVEVIHSTDKTLRAKLISPTQEAGKIWLPSGAAWVRDFIESSATFPNAANDDDIDSVMGAIELAQQGLAPMVISDDVLSQIGA